MHLAKMHTAPHGQNGAMMPGLPGIDPLGISGRNGDGTLIESGHRIDPLLGDGTLEESGHPVLMLRLMLMLGLGRFTRKSVSESAKLRILDQTLLRLTPRPSTLLLLSFKKMTIVHLARAQEEEFGSNDQHLLLQDRTGIHHLLLLLRLLYLLPAQHQLALTQETSPKSSRLPTPTPRSST